MPGSKVQTHWTERTKRKLPRRPEGAENDKGKTQRRPRDGAAYEGVARLMLALAKARRTGGWYPETASLKDALAKDGLANFNMPEFLPSRNRFLS